MTKIAVFVGSLREHSSNQALAKSLEKLAPEGMEFDYIDLNMPLYNEDVEKTGFPEMVQTAKTIVEAADGVLIATPEYNRSVPGVLKNAIDWVSRPYGASSFAGKPVGIIGSSMTPGGTMVSQADLRHIMLAVGAKVLGQPEVYLANAYEVFDETGAVLSERWLKNFEGYMNVFAQWVKNEK